MKPMLLPKWFVIYCEEHVLFWRPQNMMEKYISDCIDYSIEYYEYQHYFDETEVPE